MKASSVLGIAGAIIAIASPFITWGTVKIVTTTIPGAPAYPSEFDVPGSLIMQPLPLMLGFALVLISTFSSAINSEKQHIIEGVLLLAGGVIMLMPILYGLHAYYWGLGLMEKMNLPTGMLGITIGFGVYLYLVGAILATIAGFLALRSKPKASATLPPAP